MPFITRIQNFYARFERPISSLSLIGGFVFDVFALKRVDLFWENFWVVVHLGIVAICIILINRQENGEADPRDPAKMYFWYVNILQFFFGGLLSTFIVFYFRSATLTVTWPFMVILAAAFIANESFKRNYTRLAFQIGLFFLSLLSFAVFIVPIFFHRIGRDVFLISNVASIVVLFLFLLTLGFFTKDKFKRGRNIIRLSVLGILLATNTLYFFNLIPPIPLSLKDAGIYHSIYRNENGDYVTQSEDQGEYSYFKLYDTVHVVGYYDALYAYSAVFAPTSFNINIAHEWQKYDTTTKKWTTESVVYLQSPGGRDGGYRTYSIKYNITPGEWRVHVKTMDNQVIGQIRFNVISTNVKPALQTEIKN